MADKNSDDDGKILSFKAPEPRFPKAAVDYIDALLTIQRDRFELEKRAQNFASDTPLPRLPESSQLLAESEDFIGAGWTNIGRRRDGTAFRWMGRIGSILTQVDLSEPRTFTISGCGFTKRKFLKETTLWIEDEQIDFTLSRKGFNRWSFSGTLPALPARPYYILRLQSAGVSQLAEGVDTFVSLAVNEIRINC
jgi:hypothetical protein